MDYNQKKGNEKRVVKMKIAICDDEQEARDILKKILEEYEENLEKIDTYSSGEEFLLSDIKYDLLFLDIDMKGINGIETARKIRLKDKKLKIVYVTAYKEYAGQAFSVHAFGYLLKPVKKEKVYAQIKDALSYREEVAKEIPVIEFITLEGRIRVECDKICYFEFSNRKIKLVLNDKRYFMKGKISDIKEKMEGYGFASPHKSFVVNLDQIKNIKGYDIYLMNDEILPLSQKQAVAFKKSLSRFLIRKE